MQAIGIYYIDVDDYNDDDDDNYNDDDDDTDDADHHHNVPQYVYDIVCVELHFNKWPITNHIVNYDYEHEHQLTYHTKVVNHKCYRYRGFFFKQFLLMHILSEDMLIMR